MGLSNHAVPLVTTSKIKLSMVKMIKTLATKENHEELTENFLFCNFWTMFSLIHQQNEPQQLGYALSNTTGISIITDYFGQNEHETGEKIEPT